MEELLHLVLSKDIEKQRKIDKTNNFNSISRRMVSDWY